MGGKHDPKLALAEEHLCRKECRRGVAYREAMYERSVGEECRRGV
jgi:hypothetical protein